MGTILAKMVLHSHAHPADGVALRITIEGKETYVPAKRDGNDRNLGEDDEPGKAKGKAKGKGKGKAKP